MNTENKAKATEYAKNYPVVLIDSPFIGPVSVGHVGSYNGRVIVNLCLRTAKSDPSNASVSFPEAWPKSKMFSSGDQVNVRIEDGYVKNIWLAKAQLISYQRPSTGTINQDAVGESISREHVNNPEGNHGHVDDRPF